MKRSARRPRRTAEPLRIPTGKDSLEAYVESLKALIERSGTHVYIDTSFLVWLTALGPEARAEFVEWIRAVAPDRIHVPVWSAHEYLRHHVQNLHGKTLTGVASDLNRVAKQAFATLRPYLDNHFAGDPRAPETIISSARSALIGIKGLADLAGKWKAEHYEASSETVIALINELGLDSPPMLDWMSDIQEIEHARFEGRVPPGFQDRSKTVSGTVGSNRFGDLVFWKEILHHAAEVRATGIVIISNDGKNDWVMGGQEQPELDHELKSVSDGLSPLPRPHPMLEYEARSAAGVRELMLVDRDYLAIFLRRTGVTSDRLFGAAIEVSLPGARAEEKARRKEMRDGGGKSNSERMPVKRDGGPKHLPVDDGPNLNDGSLALKLAMAGAFTAENDKTGPLLQTMLSAESEGRGLEEFLTSARLKEWDNRAALWFARALGQRSIDGDGLASAYATDILAVLDRLPPKTATLLYLGLMSAAYVDGEAVRTIPRGPWLAQLLAQQSQPRAKIAIEAFMKYVAGRSGRPVYLPDAAVPALTVSPIVDTSKGARLAGLQIAGVGVVVEVQDDVSLRLSTRFPGRDTVTVAEVAQEACATLGIPFEQVEKTEALERTVKFGATAGIADETDLQNNMEDEA